MTAPLADGRTGSIDAVAAQRRTLRTLVAAQAIGAVGITIGIATASLLARDISGSEAQAGLAQSFQVLGAAVASFLLARLMSRSGRRAGLATGYVRDATYALHELIGGAYYRLRH
jgi:MFS family permease